MKRVATALALILALAQPAMADGWNGYNRHHHHGGGGGDAGAALFGGLVGGLIIGGMINSMNQPSYGYAPQPQYRQMCRTQWVNQWDGYYQQWVQVPVQQCRWVSY